MIPAPWLAGVIDPEEYVGLAAFVDEVLLLDYTLVLHLTFQLQPTPGLTYYLQRPTVSEFQYVINQ